MARDRASRPEAKPLRLFLAVDVPDAMRQAIVAAVAPIREEHPKARWVPPENWHVTLKFLGSTYPRLVDWVRETAARVAGEHAGFETAVEALGAFPSARRARVLWAGLRDPEGRMAAIAGTLDEALSREFRVEKRGFTPHLTVARFDPPRPLPELEDGPAIASDPWRIDRLVLYRSHLRRPAPVYEPLEAFPLAG